MQAFNFRQWIDAHRAQLLPPVGNKRVFTDGAELIYDYAISSDDEALLTVVRTGQQHFAEVIRDYLKWKKTGERRKL